MKSLNFQEEHFLWRLVRHRLEELHALDAADFSAENAAELETMRRLDRRFKASYPVKMKEARRLVHQEWRRASKIAAWLRSATSAGDAPESETTS